MEHLSKLRENLRAEKERLKREYESKGSMLEEEAQDLEDTLRKSAAASGDDVPIFDKEEFLRKFRNNHHEEWEKRHKEGAFSVLFAFILCPL